MVLYFLKFLKCFSLLSNSNKYQSIRINYKSDSLSFRYLIFTPTYKLYGWQKKYGWQRWSLFCAKLDVRKT